jgi:glucan biosynthesis protein C
MSDSVDNRRYHSLDQLRAVMMLLGLVIHSAASFTAVPLGRSWPYQDASTSIVFDVTVFFIHVFRMPLFFLMAGFFAAFLYYRRGWRTMLVNRSVRIVVPFVLFLALTFPATMSGFGFAVAGGVDGGWAETAAYLANPVAWYANLNTIHLWFLYYLILFYAAILLTVPLVRRVARPWSERVVPFLGQLIHHPLGIVLCSATTFVTLLPMSYAGLDTEAGFLVQPKILVAYGVFVVFGWLLYLNRDQVDGFAKRAWPYMITGVALSAAYLVYITKYPPGTPDPRLLGIALAATAMWTLIYGFMGLFIRYYYRPKPLGRYLSDASYWLYLVHLPFTIWIPGLMSGWAASPFAKSAITLTVTTAVGLVTYHYVVRSTAIGVLLSGKRYPRALPRYDEQGSYIRPEVAPS